ncbi:venom serine protease Bi-VSP [Ceratitis capitata]|uniref:venom serine protease Bi-VSP n=1 Tax=Ceratitis capitata TaxID=7213 RepID=UPI00061890AE|nr:venom serine protease Bi-VSP [Ceratitis capitata]
MNSSLVVLILCTFSIGFIKAQRNCVTPERSNGICSQLNNCPQVLSAHRARNQQYVTATQRACGGNLFCCAQPQALPQRQAVSNRLANPFRAQAPQTLLVKQVRGAAVVPQQFHLQQPQQQPHAVALQNRVVRQQPQINLRSIFDDNNYEASQGQFVNYRAGQSCRTPEAVDGVCLVINSCRSVLSELYQRYNDPNFVQYLRTSNRICGGNTYTVCCPSDVQPQTRPAPAPAPVSNPATSSAGTCGVVVRSFKKIVGGKASQRTDWPWIALLAYPDYSPDSPFKCGGALVSSRHVVTAAHCIRSDLSYVRLGEYDLSTNSETRHEDIGIARKESHANYNKANGKNDIGMIWLERNVQFSDSIKPICLPTSAQLRRKSYIDYTPFVAGWGKTMEGGESASVLQELQIPILRNEVCRASYARVRRLISDDQFDTSVICAGVLSGGKDTCQGDSGGPLMIPETAGGAVQFYLIGVVSYGVGCARPQIPGVYTSVQYFVDWVLSKMSS